MTKGWMRNGKDVPLAPEGWMRKGKDVPLAQGAKRAPVLSPLQQKCTHVLPTKTSEARAP